MKKVQCFRFDKKYQPKADTTKPWKVDLTGHLARAVNEMLYQLDKCNIRIIYQL